jgi:hypothetical protein
MEVGWNTVADKTDIFNWETHSSLTVLLVRRIYERDVETTPLRLPEHARWQDGGEPGLRFELEGNGICSRWIYTVHSRLMVTLVVCLRRMQAKRLRICPPFDRPIDKMEELEKLVGILWQTR